MYGITAEIINVESALLEFRNNDDLYNSGLKLFQAIDFPVTPLKDVVNLDINDFIYLYLNKKVLFSLTEQNFFNKITSVSLLFSINSEEQSVTRYQFGENFFGEILFVAIDLNSVKRDRSFDAHSITKIINKLYNHPVFILFAHENHILFSGMVYRSSKEDQSHEVYLSDWYYCFETDYESILNLCSLSFGNHSQSNLKELYYDIIYSVSRKYYIYPESQEFITYGCMTNELSSSGIVNMNMESFKSIKELAEDNSNFYQHIYDFDYVDNKENIDLFFKEDDDLLLFDIDDFTYNDLDDEDLEKIDEDFEENNGDGGDSSLEDLDDSLFEDPLKILDWLDDEDNENN
jgi:hypothetical protein